MSSTPTAGEPSRPRQVIQTKNEDAGRIKILVCGWRKAGKTSCIKTVFQGALAKDVPYFGATQKIEKVNYDSILPLQIWDTPHNFELDQLDQQDVQLGSFSTIVFVMDMQQDDSYHEAIMRFTQIATRAYIANPSMKFSVFIHKAEVLSEDYRGENYAEIQRAMSDALEDFPYSSLQRDAPHMNFSDASTVTKMQDHLMAEIRFDMTSVHDVSLREGWSKVIQGVMEMLPSVESLLLNFTETSGMDNSFLFDISSGVVLATDNRHRNEASLEQVTQYLSRFMQFRELYKGLKVASDKARPEQGTSAPTPNDNASNGVGGIDEYDGEEGEEESGWWDEEDPEAPWMTNSTRLMPRTTLALWQFTPHLVLVVMLQTDTWQTRRGMIEYNLTFLRQGVRRILMEM